MTNFWRLAAISWMKGFNRRVVAPAASNQRPIGRLILSIAKVRLIGTGKEHRTTAHAVCCAQSDDCEAKAIGAQQPSCVLNKTKGPGVGRKRVENRGILGCLTRIAAGFKKSRCRAAR